MKKYRNSGLTLGGYNKNGISPEDMVKVTMIFNYKHNNNNISPGIIVKNGIIAA